MRLEQLRYFIAVAEELHFGRAARRSHIEQPPLSRQIKALEEELGARLLERTKRRVALTEEGAYFLGEARGILERLDLAANAVREMALGRSGPLRIGFVTPVLHTPFSDAIRDFKAANPGVRLELQHESTNVQVERLRSGRLHLGFLRPYAHDLSDFETRRFWREPYVLILPEAHPLADLERVPLKRLAGEPLILFPRHVSPGLHDALMAAFHKVGVSPRIGQEVQESQATITLVATGLGLALMPRSVRREGREGLAYRPIVGDLPLVEIVTAWMKGRKTPMVERFLDFLDDYPRDGATGSDEGAMEVEMKGEMERETEEKGGNCG